MELSRYFEFAARTLKAEALISEGPHQRLQVEESPDPVGLIHIAACQTNKGSFGILGSELYTGAKAVGEPFAVRFALVPKNDKAPSTPTRSTGYHLALEQTAQLDKVIPRTYAHVLYLYTKHPEAKSLAPDGTPCVCDTRGLLQRSSVVAASRRYVGKETDRRWEQGEDLSLVEFTSFEYQQSKQVVAGEDIKQDILKTGIRKLERTTGLSHHTINKILNGERVRRKTIGKITQRVRGTAGESGSKR
jgi:hypothetical protein